MTSATFWSMPATLLTAIEPSQMIEVRFTNTYSASQNRAMMIGNTLPYRRWRNCGIV